MGPLVRGNLWLNVTLQVSVVAWLVGAASARDEADLYFVLTVISRPFEHSIRSLPSTTLANFCLHGHFVGCMSKERHTVKMSA